MGERGESIPEEENGNINERKRGEVPAIRVNMNSGNAMHKRYRLAPRARNVEAKHKRSE